MHLSSSEPPLSLVIEGWRHFTQSLALVNQYQCLELLKEPRVRLTHRDLPPPPAALLRKGKPWKRARVRIGVAEDALIEAIPAPSQAQVPDVTYRIGFPYDFTPAPRGRTVVFAVTETGHLPRFLVKGPTLAAATGGGVKVITPSDFSRAGLLASGADPGRVAVAPHGFDPSTFFPAGDEERFRLRVEMGWEGRFVFLAVGAMYPHKGISTLLRSFATLASRYPEALLVLKGNDSAYASRTALDRMASTLSAAEMARVRPALRYFGESCSSGELARLYQAGDALVAPYHAEGFNLPVIEAAACGLPVICTAAGPTDETTTEEFALRIPSALGPSPVATWGGHWLFPDQEVLATLLEKVMMDEGFRNRARVAGPAHVSARYTWRQVAARLLEEVGAA